MVSMVKFFGKYSPIQFFKDIAPAGLNAFGTCFKWISRFYFIKVCFRKDWYSWRNATSLTLPLGATINMDAVSILMSFMITLLTALGDDLSIGTMVTSILACNVLLSIGTRRSRWCYCCFTALCHCGIQAINSRCLYFSKYFVWHGSYLWNVIGDLLVRCIVDLTF